MRAGLALLLLLLLLSTMLGGNCQDTDSQQGEQTPSAMTTVIHAPQSTAARS